MILIFFILGLIYNKKTFLFFAVGLILYIGISLLVTGLDIPAGLILGV
jgi:hypothetical protein